MKRPSSPFPVAVLLPRTRMSAPVPAPPTRRPSRHLLAAVLVALLFIPACEPAPAPASITLSPTTARLSFVEDSVRFAAEVRDENGQVMDGHEVSWSTSDPGVAVITPAGLVYATGDGTVTITAAAGPASANATVTVVINPDRRPLTALYDATHGEDWAGNGGWLTGEPISQWKGVTTNDDGRVIGLHLPFNNLSGHLPPEIGDLTELRRLHLGYNSLSGPIPPEFGNLTALTQAYLYSNALTGIPAELGRLSQLTELWLFDNDLKGPLPPEVGDMAGLTRLILTKNTKLSGPLPGTLTELGEVIELLMGKTGLCAPVNDEFNQWLDRIPKRRVVSCGQPGEGSTAYLTQAVQSRVYPVPLVAGEDALLRVFVVAPAAAGDTIPLVRATFYLDGREPKVVDIEPDSSVIGKEVDESSLAYSANASIPGSLIQPGLEVVVEIDPEETTDPELGVAGRIPETGRMAVDVRSMPDLELTIIPFLWRPRPDSAILDITDSLTADDELLWPIRELLPVATIDLEIHDPVVTDSFYPAGLLHETNVIRAAEGGTGYYMGMMSGRTPRGRASLPGWTSFSAPDSGIMVHELGHNMNLYHAPCGEATGPDPSFPQRDGSIGAWGNDVSTRSLVKPATRDLMSYCDPDWISEFYFTNALRYRLYVEVAEMAAAHTVPVASLLVQGGIRQNGTPYLQPAFAVDAPPALPRKTGAYRIVGATAEGFDLFELDFAMPEVADGDGSSSFAFVVPVQPGWPEALARITLSGPEGSFTLDAGSDRPSAILRDPRTGQVRAILNNLPPEIRTAADAARLAPEPGLEVLFSRGVPDAAAWRR